MVGTTSLFNSSSISRSTSDAASLVGVKKNTNDMIKTCSGYYLI